LKLYSSIEISTFNFQFSIEEGEGVSL